MPAATWPPEKIFLVFASVGGVLLTVLIPPLLGGNETFNFHRAASVAWLHLLIEPAVIPSGIVRILETVWSAFPEGSKPPFAYSAEQFRSLAAIPLASDQPQTLEPNAIAVLHPFSYLPHLPAFWAGRLFELPPIAIFYLGRLAGLAAGIALTYQAIRIIPVHKEALAALALLPTILFSRSTFDADQLTNALAFFFVAFVMREINNEGRITGRAVITMALSAFVLAQCKSAYLFLPLLTLAIPATRFGSPAHKLRACALIVVPGLIGSFGWMIALKQSFFAGIQYQTWAGLVDPGAQQAFILSDPLAFAGVLLRTLFTTSFFPDALLGLIGVFGPPVMLPLPAFPLLFVGVLGAALLSGDSSGEAIALKSRSTRLLALLLFGSAAAIVLTLLYLQWNGVAAPVIRGFQGRYLYPVVPLLFLLLPKTVPGAGRRITAQSCLLAVGAFSVAITCWVTWTTYLA
jgi:uncharacterized membrane protein